MIARDHDRPYPCADCPFDGSHGLRSRWIDHSDEAGKDEVLLQPVIEIIQAYGGGRHGTPGDSEGAQGTASKLVIDGRYLLTAILR
jgi:hypothetical protein